MSYLPVSSNDTLSHLALQGSPETLCGKPAVEGVTISNYLTCDTCSTLSGGDSILKQTHQIEAARECPYCQDGVDLSGLTCLECGGTGQLDEDGEDEYATDLQSLDVDQPLRGTRVGYTIEASPCKNCGDTFSKEASCATCGQDRPAPQVIPLNTTTTTTAGNAEVTYTSATPATTFTASTGNTSNTAQVTNLNKDRCEECGEENDVVVQKDGQWKCVGCATKPWGGNWEDSGKKSSVEETQRKVATNWTRDGEPIENGFEVVISTDKAARTPFLDLTRVSVSEQRDCDECEDTVWISKIASCVDCDGLKCSNCMESVSLDSFLGTCKKCSGGESDLVYDDDFATDTEQDLYLSYLMAEDDDAETDPLFLPNDPE